MGRIAALLIPAALLLFVAQSSARFEEQAPTVHSHGAWRGLSHRQAFIFPAAPPMLLQTERMGNCQQLCSSGGGGRVQLLRHVLGGTRFASLHEGARAGAIATLTATTTRAASGSGTLSRNATAAAEVAMNTKMIKQPAKTSAAKKATKAGSGSAIIKATSSTKLAKTPQAKKKADSKMTGKIAAASQTGEEANDASDLRACSEEELSVEAGGEEVEAPVKRKRRASKNSWTDDALLEEFALKAIILLREAGGELESTKFQRRWKCTFPSDEIARYMRGRRLSVRQLLQQCGNTFTINDMAGSRSKKLFAITDERQTQSFSASTQALTTAIPFEPGTATLLRQVEQMLRSQVYRNDKCPF